MGEKETERWEVRGREGVEAIIPWLTEETREDRFRGSARQGSPSGLGGLVGHHPVHTWPTQQQFLH